MSPTMTIPAMKSIQGEDLVVLLLALAHQWATDPNQDDPGQQLHLSRVTAVAGRFEYVPAPQHDPQALLVYLLVLATSRQQSVHTSFSRLFCLTLCFLVVFHHFTTLYASLRLLFSVSFNLFIPNAS